jgi:hypothetical protein
MIVMVGLFIANGKMPYSAVYPRGGVVYGKVMVFRASF